MKVTDDMTVKGWALPESIMRIAIKHDRTPRQRLVFQYGTDGRVYFKPLVPDVEEFESKMMEMPDDYDLYPQVTTFRQHSLGLAELYDEPVMYSASVDDWERSAKWWLLGFGFSFKKLTDTDTERQEAA